MYLAIEFVFTCDLKKKKNPYKSKNILVKAAFHLIMSAFH